MEGCWGDVVEEEEGNANSCIEETLITRVHARTHIHYHRHRNNSVFVREGKTSHNIVSILTPPVSHCNIIFIKVQNVSFKF